MARQFPSDWLIPDWPVPQGVQAICTTRNGGVSTAPYDSLNLGDHVGDLPARVAANRLVFQQAMGAQPVFLNQVHGSDVLQLHRDTPHACTADACVTNQTGMACTVMVADCLPVLFCAVDGQCVAAAHAGWRGLAGVNGVGVLDQTFQRFCALTHINRSHVATKIIAWLGPCIGPQAFEVGDEVRAAFLKHDAMATPMFQPRATGKWLANLAGLARRRLAAVGVEQVFGNDGSDAWCTAAQPSRFFSHRRDRVSGRFAASIWRES